MKSLKIIFASLILAFLVLNMVSAQEPTCVYFFYGDGCQHCARIEPLINNLEIQSEFPVEVNRFEIYNNRSNMVLLNDYFDAYNISNSERGIPVVLIGNNYLIGDKPIIENLDTIIEQNKGLECPNLEIKNVI
jgi:hypothetical protein